MQITEVVHYHLGSLVLLKPFFDKLKVAEIIDDTVVSDAEVSLGKLVEIMLYNRLDSATPLYQVQSWAEATAIETVYDISPSLLNDDRLGRMLDCIHPHLMFLQSQIVLEACKSFDLKFSQLHQDTSTFSVYGSYENGDPDDLKVTYGYSKDHRPDLKQLVFEVTVSADGSVPVLVCPKDGNSSDVTLHIENLNRLRENFGLKDFLYIADSKFSSEANMLDVILHQGHFLSTATFTQKLKDDFISYLDENVEFEDLTYLPKSQQKKPLSQRESYHGFEIEEILRDDEGNAYPIRTIFIKSTQLEKQRKATREGKMTKIMKRLDKISSLINKYDYKTEEIIKQRVEKALNMNPTGTLFSYQIIQHEDNTFQLDYQIEKEQLKRLQKLDGIYVMKSNLLKDTHSINQLLYLYKQQIQVEKRIGNLKGPLAVSPMFLKSEKRIEAMLFIITIALLIFSLVEREVRNKMTKPLRGLLPENRPTDAPTANKIFQAFENIALDVVCFDDQTRQTAPIRLNNIQKTILDLINIPHPSIKTLKKGCGM